MQTEVLNFRIPDNRQVANLDIRGITVLFQHPGHFFRVIRQLTPAGHLIFTLLFPLMPQNPAGHKECDQADNQRHNGSQHEGRPELLTTPEHVFVMQDLGGIHPEGFAVILDLIDRLGLD